MKHFIQSLDVVINVEHISSILAGHRQDGRTTITLNNGNEFYLDQSITELLIAIAEAYQNDR
jgi:uncharacterized protein YlzI (FlbEa/FlbD family)